MRCVIVLAVAIVAVASPSCVKRNSHGSGENDGHYCVCNSTYCDEVPVLHRSVLSSEYKLVTSSQSGLRFHLSSDMFGDVRPHNESVGKIIVDSTDRYQEIIGFGGAVTDAAGLNIKSLSPDTELRLMKSYFGQSGLEYTVIRTPLGGSDFSTRPYSYAMVENDILLEHFELQEEDYQYKMPIIHKAIELSKNKIKLIASPWSASPWMKGSKWTSEGKLLRKYWETWANYFVKYFEAYGREGFEFWGLTPQNEPMLYTYSNASINGMAWTAEEQREWMLDHLLPTLNRTGFRYIKIFVGDENRSFLPDWPTTVMEDKRVRGAVDGTAVHWYHDKTASPERLDQTKKRFPEKTLLYTEACNGAAQKENVILGSWQRGELYARNIIEVLSHWVSGWIDWNIALNLRGGPNYISNFVDSPIIVNATADEFYKQPMFYALGHFSKYIPPRSVRIASKAEELNGVDQVAFATPDKGTVLIMLNTNNEERKVLIQDPRKGGTTVTLKAKSINTMKYW